MFMLDGPQPGFPIHAMKVTNDILSLNLATETEKSVSRRVTADARFIEGWMCGTYVVAGIFAIPVECFTVSQLQWNIPTLYDATKKAKQGCWPRGLSGTLLFPFYIGIAFEPAVIEWVQRRKPYRWAIWHEPVLYAIARNTVWMRSDYGHFGSAFYPLVFQLYRRALTLIAEQLQKRMPDFINGIPTNRQSA